MISRSCWSPSSASWSEKCDALPAIASCVTCATTYCPPGLPGAQSACPAVLPGAQSACPPGLPGA
eukprot:3084248-Pleurochrysis_carterae.AAC.1